MSPAPMALLQSGIPLSLLLDLVLGPRSEELLEAERREPVVPCSGAGPRSRPRALARG